MAKGADFSHADLSGAMLFSMQLKGANSEGAKLAAARFIGDMSHANRRDTDLTGLRGSVDMKNQSMGLMRASFVSPDLRRANFTGAELARADFGFADMRNARFVGANLCGAEFASSDLRGADPSGADLRGAKFIDTQFHEAILAGARFDGATWRGVQGMENAAGRGRGLPRPSCANAYCQHILCGREAEGLADSQTHITYLLLLAKDRKTPPANRWRIRHKAICRDQARAAGHSRTTAAHE